MNIVLVEFNAHHDECIFSQVAFLKTLPNLKLYLISNYRLKGRIAYLDEFKETLFVRSNQWGIGHLKVLQFLNKNKIDKVIFNTVPNKSAHNLLKVCSKKKREYYGVLHNLKDLKNTKYLHTYKTINGFYLLNDYLLDNTKTNNLLKAKFGSFYPIFFKECSEVKLKKGKDEIWVTIPGKMELKRRNYIQLFEFFKAGNLNKNIKLIFLGKSDPNLSKEFKKYDLNNNCMFWDGFIDNNLFHSYLQKSDYILPIIHNKHILSNAYQYKISGSFNLAFSYHVPMILDSFFNQFDDFKTTALFYKKEDNLIAVLNKLEKPICKFNNEKWSFEFQQNKFVNLLKCNK
ncbi:hypothetical protein [Wenyingzhuangia aestuarii]|uniref:hypothetical protein n=1 Tax=Wenyingzhuangia aestuarii TaxID=1647582 RepID=UPI00143CAC44|nr:hypothetical protein [Wenyingzhuangia aestuarii]NJB82896.1 hypothetical protein [Wenyingzhuangia aestuarii]